MAWRQNLVKSFARLLGVRNYNAAKSSGHVWGGARATASANVNADLAADLPMLRMRSRNAWQNGPTARAAVESDVALVVSTGIDVEPDTGDEQANELLREAWNRFAKHASACGTLDLWELQRQARRSEKLAGEFLWVIVDTDAYDQRGIPRAIMPVEPDRLSSTPLEPIAAGASFACGVEFDRFGRRIAYHISDTADGDIDQYPKGGTLVAGSGGVGVDTIAVQNTGKKGGKRYLAADIIHGYDCQRPGQIRGEPSLGPVLNTLRQEAELVEAELTAAKVGSAHAIKIRTTTPTLPGEEGDTTSSPPTYDFKPGTINLLAPGEDAEIMANPRPSQQISPFRQMLRGDVAAATGVPQRFLDRDTSRANYSSMRADMMDTQRIMTPQQHRFGRQAAEEVYRRVLPQLATAAGVDIPTDPDELAEFYRCKLMPDGWSYVDPVKDIGAASDAINSGLSTYQEELSSRGKDYRQVWKQIASEQKLAKDLAIKLDMSATNAPIQQPQGGRPNAVKPPAESAQDQKPDQPTDQPADQD